MSYVFHVRPHPLGVVVAKRPGVRGELLLPGETCCGVDYDQLARIAATTGYVEVPEPASADCPLHCDALSRSF
ncbi:MAG TPA: hypothetical protein VF816_01545 [Rhodocyclaceae bacterium]